jgi:hypothetical protein
MVPSPVDREKLEEFSKTDEIGNGGSLGIQKLLVFSE